MLWRSLSHDNIIQTNLTIHLNGYVEKGLYINLNTRIAYQLCRLNGFASKIVLKREKDFSNKI